MTILTDLFFYLRIMSKHKFDRLGEASKSGRCMPGLMRTVRVLQAGRQDIVKPLIEPSASLARRATLPLPAEYGLDLCLPMAPTKASAFPPKIKTKKKKRKKLQLSMARLV